MARIEYSSIVSNISGSVGPITFRHDSGGPLCYQRPGTKSMVSDNLLRHRQIVQQANTDWANLTADEKKFWTTAAAYESTAGKFNSLKIAIPRHFYLAWRIRCLHAGASCTYNTQPPTPIYVSGYFRLILFRPGLATQFYSYPVGYLPPYPRCAVWLSWPAGGTQQAGRKWFKFLPTPAFIGHAAGVTLDSVLFDAMGYPPEVTAEVSAYYQWTHKPMMRAYGVYASGQIQVMADRFLDPSTSGYYVKFPPTAPVYSGTAS